jgi:regulator of replication initiation timing
MSRIHKQLRSQLERQRNMLRVLHQKLETCSLLTIENQDLRQRLTRAESTIEYLRKGILREAARLKEGATSTTSHPTK